MTQKQTSRLDVARYRVMTTQELQEMVSHPHTYDEDQRKVAKKVLAERQANKAIDRMTRGRVKCDQCQMVAILGSPTHETGCPNARSRWNAETGEWIKQARCPECMEMVDKGEECACYVDSDAS